MPELNTINNVEINLYFPCLQYLQIITFFGGQVYTNGATGSEANRLSFAGEYLDGDASLLISDLLLTDSGEYNCKVKTGGKYHWSQVNLIVLGECCQTHCITHTQAAFSPKPICTNTHTASHTHTCRPNHWIISLAHFLRHAD